MPSHTRRMLLDLDRCWTDEHVEGSTSLRRFKDSVHDYCECASRVPVIGWVLTALCSL